MSRATEQAGRGRAIEAWRFRSTLTLLRTSVAFSLLGLVGGATLAGAASSEADRQFAIAYTSAQATQHLAPAVLLGLRRPAPPPAILSDDAPEGIVATRLFWRMGLTGGVFAVLLGAGGAILLRRHWIKAAEGAALDQVLRGNRVATADELTRLVLKARPPEPLLRIGGVPIPPEDETRHFLDIGKSGTGKTSVLHDHVGQIAARGEHALIFDPDGSYKERFHRPERGDVILDPWDARSHRWDMLADIGSLDDAHRIAAILLPKPATAGESGFWFDQARTLLAHILDHQARSGSTSLADLSAALNTTTADDLRAIVAGTPAARIFEAGGERATASVLFMMTVAARTVATLAGTAQDAPAFSFDRFYAGLAEQNGPKPMIFLAAPRRYREAGAPVIAAAIDAAASAILQRTPGDAPKAWLFLDELASLPPVQSLLTLLPEGRKHRACVVIAFQSIAQLRQTYGAEGAEIISGQTATQLIMAVGDGATAKWAVDLIGSAEVENQRVSETLGDDPKARGSMGIHRERKSLVLDSELTNLAIGEGFLRLSGLPLAKVRIAPPKAMDIIAPAFVPADTAPRTPPSSTDTPPSAPVRMEDREDWLGMGGL
jgi:hypothetical protein